MTEQTKQHLFQVTFALAGLLYLWSIYVIWEVPGWLEGQSYFVIGVVPALIGVVSLAVALGLHLDILQEE